MITVDVEKIKRAIKGDKSIFSEIINERKEDIYRIAFVYVRNEDDALYVFSDTVYKAYVSIKKLNKPEYFNTWLTRIIINCSLNSLNKKEKIIEKEILIAEEDISDSNLSNIEEIIISRIDLMNSIEKLTFNEKTIIMLKYFQDFTLTQISEVLSCPIGTVKTRLHKALEFLRTELKS